MTSKVAVKDYMTTGVDSLPYNISVGEAIELLLKSKHAYFPVTRNNYLVGVVNAADLLRHYKTPEMPIKDMTGRKLIVARPDVFLDDAARIMFRNGLKRLPVIDEKGKLVGIITNTDIVRSHIERATPRKVDMIKNLIEGEHRVKVTVERYDVPIDKLHPTQDTIYADELEGRKYELKRGLAEPLIVVKKRNYFVLVDGHHRAVAARGLDMDELTAHVLEMDKDVELGMEKTARERNLITLDDIKIMDYAQHPLVEITTKLIERKHLK
ncbi:MAG: CBS domain-containing protein [Candidatus Altiarchaeota archaeon]|nr:CBS domain-containing protein [Candidatus Altiarchaeota archaeon]